MENATKAIIITASVLITMAIVSLGFFIFNSVKTPIDSGKDELDRIYKQLTESKYADYNNKTWSGTEVINAISKSKSAPEEGVGICVITGVGGTTYTNWYVYDASDINNLSEATTSIDDAEDIFKTDKYINPNGRFKAKVERNNNDKIASVTFTQQ